jgi:MFS family permease
MTCLETYRVAAAANTPAGISIISSYFPPGKSKNTAFAVLGAGQPIGYIIGMILGELLRRLRAAMAYRIPRWYPESVERFVAYYLLVASRPGMHSLSPRLVHSTRR